LRLALPQQTTKLFRATICKFRLKSKLAAANQRQANLKITTEAAKKAQAQIKITPCGVTREHK